MGNVVLKSDDLKWLKKMLPLSTAVMGQVSGHDPNSFELERISLEQSSYGAVTCRTSIRSNMFNEWRGSWNLDLEAVNTNIFYSENNPNLWIEIHGLYLTPFAYAGEALTVRAQESLKNTSLLEIPFFPNSGLFGRKELYRTATGELKVRTLKRGVLSPDGNVVEAFNFFNFQTLVTADQLATAIKEEESKRIELAEPVSNARERYRHSLEPRTAE